MRLFSAALVTLAVVAADFLCGTGAFEFSDKDAKGWSLASTLVLIAFFVLAFMESNRARGSKA